jgi:hypothetical protein
METTEPGFAHPATAVQNLDPSNTLSHYAVAFPVLTLVAFDGVFMMRRHRIASTVP